MLCSNAFCFGLLCSNAFCFGLLSGKAFCFSLLCSNAFCFGLLCSQAFCFSLLCSKALCFGLLCCKAFCFSLLCRKTFGFSFALRSGKCRGGSSGCGCRRYFSCSFFRVGIFGGKARGFSLFRSQTFRLQACRFGCLGSLSLGCETCSFCRLRCETFGFGIGFCFGLRDTGGFRFLGSDTFRFQVFGFRRRHGQLLGIGQGHGFVIARDIQTVTQILAVAEVLRCRRRKCIAKTDKAIFQQADQGHGLRRCLQRNHTVPDVRGQIAECRNAFFVRDPVHRFQTLQIGFCRTCRVADARHFRHGEGAVHGVNSTNHRFVGDRRLARQPVVQVHHMALDFRRQDFQQHRIDLHRHMRRRRNFRRRCKGTHVSHFFTVRQLIGGVFDAVQINFRYRFIPECAIERRQFIHCGTDQGDDFRRCRT